MPNTATPKLTRVLFVCLGNICRSPTAHAVFRDLVQNAELGKYIEVDSAGTAAYHIGRQADPRTRAYANTQNIAIDDLRARQVSIDDFLHYDYVLAMDNENLKNLQQLKQSDPATQHTGTAPQLFLSFATAQHLKQQEVPDPYYGGSEGFAQVFELCRQGAEGLLQSIQERWSC